MSDAWLKPALLGIDRPQVIAADGALGALLQQIGPGDDAALAYSRGVGAIAACGLAAVRVGASENVPLPAPAAHDAQVVPDAHPWTALLAAVFARSVVAQGHDVRLRHEVCLRLAAHQRTLPHAVLPQALDAGARSVPLRTRLLPVLGVRGQWLAACNPAWAFAHADAVGEAATPADETALAWDDARHDTRLAWFAHTRHTDPALARERLQDHLKAMSARERVDFVGALAAQLEPDDAPLLQSLLKDRSREVRALVGPLLAQLPASPHAQRIADWMQPLLVKRSGLLRRTSWECEAPKAADPQWADAGIEPKRPQYDDLGERAWWLYQLVRQLPLAWWSSHTSMTPVQLLAFARGTDWEAALQRGWLERIDATQPAWLAAMLDDRSLHAHTPRLLAMLPVLQREQYWPDTLDALAGEGMLSDVLGSCAPGETLTAHYSARLVPGVCACFASDRLRHDYLLRQQLLELASLLHPSVLSHVLLPAQPDDTTDSMRACAHDLLRIVEVRHALHSSF